MAEVKGWRVDYNVDRYSEGSRPLREGQPTPRVRPWHRAARNDVELWFRTALGRDGRLICVELDVRSAAPLTSTALRSIPLTAILEWMSRRDLTPEDVGAPMQPSTRLRRWEYQESDLANLDRDGLRDAFLNNSRRALGATPRPRRGGQGPSTEDLERFAEAYRLASRRAPRSAIAETVSILESDGFRISPATAHRWRAACRDTDPPLLDPKGIS